MPKLELNFACADYDRTQALADGSVKANGIELNVLKLPPDEIFFRMMQNEEFDMSELSVSSYLIAKDRGTPRFTALPVFLSRTFRHSSIYVHRDGGILSPEQLRGKRIGVPEYHVTALVWVRGLLQYEYGIHPSELDWYWGGVDTPRRKPERVSIELPNDIRLTAIAPEQTLNQMLQDGQIDAIISPRAPAGFLQPSGKIVRLFEDYAAIEKQYFQKTGIFPIMHVVVVKDEILQRNPWAALSLYHAFVQAKEKAYDNLHQIGSLRVTLPWLAEEVASTEQLMGRDFWPYGIERNRTALDALISYSHEQGLIHRKHPLEELFAKSTLDS
ncbi:ABC transporter substrate-binding protein [Cohnella sp. WQ 127256]|uniref:ABC transporter substrate-binding protein n=1 Tax=Cohnella sp. WQ 127256 TaxID=2938790 RepID=UPI0021195E5C|nr:ABC transporter substrate-binding protein [Cohnella sp. WQ 127256]